MNPELFEQLLNEEEGPTLDFKRDQYPFSKASDEERAELLKDILGFANAWRRTEAYILIGVDDVRGGRSIVHGIQEDQPLTDHTLQQFVNSKTNQPIDFHYGAFTYEDKPVAFIRIEQQARPFYLKRNFGFLKAEAVYVRRGSSTDPTKPALPGEIARMGLGAGEQPAKLKVEFAAVNSDESLGASTQWNAEFLRLPPAHQIPNLRSPEHGTLGSLADLVSNVNTNYYRELANFEYMRRLFKPVRLVVENFGSHAASNVRLELDIPRDGRTIALEDSKRPAPPSRNNNFGSTHIPGLRPHRPWPGYIGIDTNANRFRVEADCGDLQPSRQVRTDTFYVAVKESGTTRLSGRLYASNLPKAQPFELEITASVTESTLTVTDLLRLPEQQGRFG